MSTPEGYATPEGSSYRYVYQYKDHLGNTRLSYTKNDAGILEIIEENNYYPFGLKHKGYNNTISSLGNSTAQLLKFGGKEVQDELGLNLLAYEYRTSDPALGRFLQIDPKSEKYYPINPYNFTANNPILLTDPKGDTIRIYGSDEFKQQAQKDLNTLKQDKMFNKIIGFLDSNKIDVNISEATSIIGAIKNLFSEGSGDKDIVTSSITTLV